MDEHKSYKWKVCNGSMLWTGSIFAAHNFVLRAGGESLQTIIIGNEMYEELRNGMVDDFLETFPNVRQLTVIDKLGVWASTFAMQLK